MADPVDPCKDANASSVYNSCYNTFKDNHPNINSFSELKDKIAKIKIPELLKERLIKLYPKEIAKLAEAILFENIRVRIIKEKGKGWKVTEEELKERIEELGEHVNSDASIQTLDNYFDSAWKMYILARYSFHTTKPEYNLIGRLHKPDVLIASASSTNSQRIDIGENLYWKTTWHGEEVSFMQYTLQADYWDIFVNDAWILGGIHGGKEFILLSHLGWNNLYDLGRNDITVTAREYIGLSAAGYVFHRGDGNSNSKNPQILIHGTLKGGNTSFNCECYLSKISKERPLIKLYETYKKLPKNLTLHAAQHYVEDPDGNTDFNAEATDDERSLLTAKTDKGFGTSLTKVLKDRAGNLNLDLTGINLSGITLDGVNASKLSFQFACLDNASLRNSNFDHTDFRWANLGLATSEYIQNLKPGEFSSANTVSIDNTRFDFSNFSGQENFVNKYLSENKTILKGNSANVYVRDSLEDIGLSGTEGYLSNSPDILSSQSELAREAKQALCNTQWEATFLDTIIMDQENYIYIRVNNIGIKAVGFPKEKDSKIKTSYPNACVYLYYRNFSAANGGDNWILYGKEKIEKLGAGNKGIIGPFKWKNPDSNVNYCFLAYVSLDGDSLTELNTSNFEHIVSRDNTVCWRNLAYIDDGADSTFSMIGLSESSTANYTLSIKAGKKVESDPISINRGEELEVTLTYDASAKKITFTSEKNILFKGQNYINLDEKTTSIIASQKYGNTILGSVNFNFNSSDEQRTHASLFFNP